MTILLDEGGAWKPEDLQGELTPTFTVRRLSDVRGLLEEHFDLQPPEQPPIDAAQGSKPLEL